MSEIRIETLVDGGVDIEPCPIKGEVRLDGPVRVTGRLQSTKGGANYNWSQFEVPSFGAPYEPRVSLEFRGNVVIRWLGWHNASEQIAGPRPALSWGGSLVNEPATIEGDEVIDLSHRAYRVTLFGALCPTGAESRQGNLVAQEICLSNGHRADVARNARFEEWTPGLSKDLGIEELSLWRRPNRPVVLGNHALFVDGAIGLDNRRLVMITDDRKVTSPDHPLDPLGLWPGLWLLSLEQADPNSYPGWGE